MENMPEHTNSRRGFLTGLAGAAVAGLARPRKAHSQGPRTLTIWHTEPAETAKRAVQKVADKFTQMHPGVTVVQEGIAWGDLGPKLVTAIVAGNPPDIAQIQPYMWRSLQKKGLIAPIDDVIKHVGVDNIQEVVRDIPKYDGHWYGISHHLGASTLLIRKDLAQEAGFKVPSDITTPMFPTWKDQIEYLEKVTSADKRRYGMSVPGTGYFLQEHLGRWVASNGGSFYDEKWNPAFHREPFMGTLEFLKTLADKKVLPPDWLGQSYAGASVEFVTGVTTMFDHTKGRSAIDIAKHAPDKNTEEYFWPIWRPVGPSGKKSFTDLDCEFWVVFAKSKQQDLAREWIKLFFEKDLYLNYIAQFPVHMIPTTKSLLKDPEYRALPDLNRWKNWVQYQIEYISRKEAAPVGVYGAHESQIPFQMEIFDSGIIMDELMAIIQNRRKVKEAAQRISDRANDIIKRLRYPVPDPIRGDKKV